jgi:hypothetical protein
MDPSFLSAGIFDIETNTDLEWYSSPFHHLARKREEKWYSSSTKQQIQILYLFAAALWIILIYVFGWYSIWKLGLSSIIGYALLLIPLFVFAINFESVNSCSFEIESEMFQGNFLSFGFLIVVILINWNKVGNQPRLFQILLVSLFFIMLSLVDFWIRKEKLILVKHVRTIFQTIALILLAYALFIYYFDLVLNSPPKDLSK